MLDTDYAVIVDSGRVTYASMTLGTILTVLTTNHLGRELLISNTFNQDVWLTFNGSNWIALPLSQGGGVDGIRVIIPAGTVLGALPISATPTSGWLGLSNI